TLTTQLSTLPLHHPLQLSRISMTEQATEDKGRFVHFDNSPFELFQPYPPAGDQPEAIIGLTQGVQDGLMFQTLLGVTGSGKTFRSEEHTSELQSRFDLVCR